MYPYSHLRAWCSWPNRKTAGIASAKAPPIKMTDAAKEAAMKELEGRTGDTDSEPEE